MRRRRDQISDSENARRARQREQSLAAVAQLLYSRRQTARALGGISIATVQRLEARQPKTFPAQRAEATDVAPR
jgi:hypothetical protein